MANQLGEVMRVRLSTFDWPHNTERGLVSALPFVDIRIQPDGDWYANLLCEALDQLDPKAELIGYWDANRNRADRRMDVSIRPFAVVADDPLEADYEKPSTIWAVDADGRLSVVDTYFPASGLWSSADLRRSMHAGYSQHDWFDVVISVHEGGRGGGGLPLHDIISFLWDHGIDLAFVGTNVGWLATRVWKFGRRIRGSRKADLRARQQAQYWSQVGIENPRLIRAWFETKDEWLVAEVAQRLRLGTVSAADLLVALGYEPARGQKMWVLSASRRAQRKRRKWMRSETTQGF